MRPNPGIPERRDPAMLNKGMNKMFVWLCIAFFVVGAILTYILTDGPHEDTREVRIYGDMECVYNVTADVIEECVEVQG